MNLSKLTDAQLVTLRDNLQKFHTGIAGDVISLERSNMRITIADSRLNDLIYILFVEAHNELYERFKTRIEL